MAKNKRPNRHSNPSSHAKHNRGNGKFLYIKKKNRAVKNLFRTEG